jgi:putative Mn2+ efflux pump MntP
MQIERVLAVAVALGCDAFSVAVGIGAVKISRGRVFRLAFHFGLFQFFMPLLGLSIGRFAVHWIGRTAPWIAAGLLLLIGVNMIRLATQKTATEDISESDPTRGWSLIFLSFSTSVDALAAGFGLGLLGTDILLACLIIGVVAAAMTVTGMLIGAGIKQTVGRKAEYFGGGVLILLALSFII